MSRAGYVYLVMASFGTLALLLAFGLLPGPTGDYGFAAIRVAEHGAPAAGAGPGVRADRRWLEGRTGAAACLAAAGASRRAEPCLRADERRHDQGRRSTVSSASSSTCWASRPGGRAWSVLSIGGATAVLGVLQALMQRRPEAHARLQHDREYRHHVLSVLGWRWRSRRTAYGLGGRAGSDGGAVSRLQPRDFQEPAVLRRRRGADARPTSAIWSAWAG